MNPCSILEPRLKSSVLVFMQQERSFNEFLSRPEHRPQVEEAQRVELEQLLTVQEQIKELEFEQKVGNLPRI